MNIIVSTGIVPECLLSSNLYITCILIHTNRDIHSSNWYTMNTLIYMNTLIMAAAIKCMQYQYKLIIYKPCQPCGEKKPLMCTFLPSMLDEEIQWAWSVTKNILHSSSHLYRCLKVFSIGFYCANHFGDNHRAGPTSQPDLARGLVVVLLSCSFFWTFKWASSTTLWS